MDKTIHDLGRILLNAIPTFLVVLFLIFYLRAVFFGPLAGILQKRFDETEGAKRAAEESMKRAEERIAEYERKLRAAREEIYANQVKAYKQLEVENGARLEEARRAAERRVLMAFAELQKQADEARLMLEARSGELADRIVARLLEGRAA